MKHSPYFRMNTLPDYIILLINYKSYQMAGMVSAVDLNVVHPGKRKQCLGAYSLISTA